MSLLIARCRAKLSRTDVRFARLPQMQLSNIDESAGTFDVQFLMMMVWRDLTMDSKKYRIGQTLSEEDMNGLSRPPIVDFPNMRSEEDTYKAQEAQPKLIPLHIAGVDFMYGPKVKKGDIGILMVRKVAGTFLEQFELKSVYLSVSFSSSCRLRVYSWVRSHLVQDVSLRRSAPPYNCKTDGKRFGHQTETIYVTVHQSNTTQQSLAAVPQSRLSVCHVRFARL